MLSTIRSAPAATATAFGPKAATVIVGGGDGGCDRRKPLTRSPASSPRTSASASLERVGRAGPRTGVPSGDRVARRPERDVHRSARAGDGLERDRDLHRRAHGHGERAEHELDPFRATGDDARHRGRVGLRHLGHPQLFISEPVGGERQLEVALQRTIEPLPQHDRQPHVATLRRRGSQYGHRRGCDRDDHDDAGDAAVQRQAGRGRRHRALPAGGAAGAVGRERPAAAVSRADRPRSTCDRGRLVPARIRSLRADTARSGRVPR